MHAFEYEAPKTLADAIKLFATTNGDGRLLAGGTDLIDQMRLGRHCPQVVIDVKKIPELKRLEIDEAGLHIGASTTCAEIQANPEISERFSALTDSCQIIGGIQIQSRASLGGNLCNASPAADSIPSMVALNGVCVIAGPKGQRELPVEEFCTGPGANDLRLGEILVEVRFPIPPANSGSHYRRMIPRNEMDIAVAGCASYVELSEDGQQIKQARISLGAVAPKPILATEAAEFLLNKPIDEPLLIQSAELARGTTEPIDDMRGTARYRTRVTGVLVKRTLELAIARARGAQVEYHPGR